MSLTFRKGNYYYGENNSFRALDAFGLLTNTFKQRFKNGEVTQLPPGYLYNTITRRFYPNTAKVRQRFSNLNNVNNILQPASIFDYDLTRVDYRTIVQKYNTSPTRNKQPQEMLNLTALDGWTGVKAYKNITTPGYNSLNTIGRIIPFLKQQIKTTGALKYYVSVSGDYLLSGEHRTIKTDSKPKILTNILDVNESVRNTITEIKSLIEEAQLNGSGYNFQGLRSFYLYYVGYKPTRGASYIPLPFKTMSVINPKNENDNECFKWCLTIHEALRQGHTKDLQRISKLKKYTDNLNLEGVKYPFIVSDSNIKKVETNNNLSINVFHYEKKCIYPLHISNVFTQDKNKQVNLLLITDGDKKHFTYIKNYNTLISNQTNNDTHKYYHCHYCLCGFTSEQILNKHITDGCQSFGLQKTILPTKGKDDTLQFKNYNKQFKAPFVIYADFESVLKQVNNEEIHIPSGFCIYPVCINKDINLKPILYTATNEEEQKQVITKFYEELQKLEFQYITVSQKYKEISKMKITNQQKEEHKRTNNCHICHSKFTSNDTTVFDHCHITGQYRGKAHQECNINLNDKNYKIPVFFHNLKGYDSHFIIREITKDKHTYINKEGKEITSKVDVVANNSEKYITFSFRKLQFLDTMAFLNSSLDKLVSTLVKSGNTLIHTKKHLNNDMFKLAQRKGVFPYEYINNINVLNEQQLPSKDKFYSKLSEKGITDAEFKHAQNVWNTGKMETLKEYHDFYLMTDVLLLADVFENFRENGLKSYGLDPARYWTLPGYSWDCMLKFTGVKLELLTDINMYQFCEKGIRGGVSLIAHRYAKANNKYIDDEIDKLNIERKQNNEPLLKKMYDPNKPNSFIIYVDANNLYGGEGGMSGLLPYKDFKWVETSNFNINNVENEGEKGYIIECDIEYPETLHDLHNCLPVAPENLAVKNLQKSEWQMETQKQLDIKENKVGKLVPNLMNKTNYILHYKNLKYYLKLGLKLNKVHRVLEFSQKRWLEPFIKFNTEKRTEATKIKDDIGKDFYKLMNNAVFGKTMENVRNRIDYELTDDIKRAKKLSSCPRYSSHQIIRSETENDTGLVGFCRNKTTIKLDKPVYVGLTILDNSKLTMYNFHYEYIKKKYDDKAKLLFTDTDSLCYHIETEDIYSDFKKDTVERFDFSNYNKNHPNFNNDNESQLGKFVDGQFQGYFKDETKGVPIVEFCGIRSKCYSILLPGDIDKKTLKGVKRSAMDRIHHSDYKRCLFPVNEEDKKQSISFHSIRSTKHQVKTIKINKTSLSCYDDKKYIYDGVNSYSYGHKCITK